VAHAKAHRHLALGMVRKPYDSKNLPGIVDFIMQLGHSSVPAHMPTGLELYDPE
jgi:hypothetical protein